MPIENNMVLVDSPPAQLPSDVGPIGSSERSDGNDPLILDSPEEWNFSLDYGQVRWGETWGKCSC